MGKSYRPLRGLKSLEVSCVSNLDLSSYRIEATVILEPGVPHEWAPVDTAGKAASLLILCSSFVEPPERLEGAREVGVGTVEARVELERHAVVDRRLFILARKIMGSPAPVRMNIESGSRLTALFMAAIASACRA